MANVLIPDPVTADNCGVVLQTWSILKPGGSTVNSPATGINSASGQTFDVGVSTVTYTVADAAGNTATCLFTVTILDVTPPNLTIGCANVTDNVSGNGCSVVPAALGDPTYSDNCWATNLLTLTYAMTGATTGSGTGSVKGLTFNVGVTTVTYTLKDPDNNTATCTFTVTIHDITPPGITIGCANVSDNVSGNGCSVVPASLGDPTYSDNCWPVAQLTLTYNITGATTGSGTGSVKGLTFNVGVSTVTYTVTDPDGNSANCVFTVTIHDIISPNITIGCANVSDNVSGNGCSVVPPAIGDPTYSDNCWPVAQLTLTYNITGATTNSGTGSVKGLTFNVGVSTVTYTVTDPDGNSASCSFTVTIHDITPPNITIGCTNVSETTLANNCSKVPINILPPTYSDNCWPVAQLTLTYTMTGATTGTGNGSVVGLTFNAGLTTVTYKVTDPDGNFAECSFTVTIIPLTPPAFTVGCPPNPAPVTVTPGNCDAYVSIPIPAVTDPCSIGYTLVNNFNNTNDASGTYPLGNTTVIWTITPTVGTPITCNQIVTVNDLPLACPLNITVPADAGQSYASNVVVPPPTFSNCSGLTLIWTMVLPNATTTDSPLTGINVVSSPGTFNVGVTTITYTLTHADGTKENCSFTITVTSKPDITCQPPIVHITDPGECNYSVNPGVPTLVDGAQPITWTWLIDGPGTPAEATGTFLGSVGNPGPPNIGVYDFKLGTSTITWTATNISGSDACTQTVTITDTEKPTLVLPTPFSECVLNIINAAYEPTTMDITPARPDYYSFITGDTKLDLDPTKFADNCLLNCPPVAIRWQIDFFGGTPTSISGTGQPSTHANFQIPGDGVTFNDRIHTITYWITDCSGNESLPVTQNITVKPRPNVIKVP